MVDREGQIAPIIDLDFRSPEVLKPSWLQEKVCTFMLPMGVNRRPIVGCVMIDSAYDARR